MKTGSWFTFRWQFILSEHFYLNSGYKILFIYQELSHVVNFWVYELQETESCAHAYFCCYYTGKLSWKIILCNMLHL